MKIIPDTDAIDLWCYGKSVNTQAGYRQSIESLLAFTGKPLPETTFADLVRWLQSMEQVGLKTATVNRHISAARSLFAFLEYEGYIERSPATRLKVRKVRDQLSERILTESEVEKMIHAQPPDDLGPSIDAVRELRKEGLGCDRIACQLNERGLTYYKGKAWTGKRVAKLYQWLDCQRMAERTRRRDTLFVKTAYYSGARASELVAMKWKDLRLTPTGRPTIFIFGKGDKTRAVAVPKPLYDELVAYGDGAEPGEYIFTHQRVENDPLPITSRHLRRVIVNRAKWAGIFNEETKAISPHWLRHACASHMIARGGEGILLVVQNHLGHSSITTTSRYLHLQGNENAADYLKWFEAAA